MSPAPLGLNKPAGATPPKDYPPAKGASIWLQTIGHTS